MEEWAKIESDEEIVWFNLGTELYRAKVNGEEEGDLWAWEMAEELVNFLREVGVEGEVVEVKRGGGFFDVYVIARRVGR